MFSKEIHTLYKLYKKKRKEKREWKLRERETQKYNYNR